MDFDAEVTVRRTRFVSEQTGWAVVDAADEDGDPVVLVGPLIHLEERERARVLGRPRGGCSVDDAPATRPT